MLSKVSEVKEIDIAGPWDTKSGGRLSVLFGMNMDKLKDQYFSYPTEAITDIDIRGLRAYMVSGLAKGSVGAKEWHKARNELVFAISGKVEWKCEDINGSFKIIILDEKAGVWTPPGILHTYTALEDNSSLLVIANTLFDPNKPETHDTYSTDSFKELQKKTSPSYNEADV